MSIAVQPQSIFAIGPKRSFGNSQTTVSGYTAVLESTSDVLEITQQPVQQGASIADHAFKKPTTFTLQFLLAFNLTKSLTALYQQLLAFQQPTVVAPTLPPGVIGPLPAPGLPELLLLTVATPKRVYQNMLLVSIGVTTDKRTENCLAVQASFQEVITVPVTTTTVPKSSLRNRGSNQGTQKAGKKQVSSGLNTLLGGG